MRKLLIVLLISCFAVGCTAFTAVSNPTPTPIPLPPTTDALWVDAGYIADDLGVTVEDAIRRVSMQDRIGELNAQLQANERDTFAGLWIEHEPNYQIVVAFTKEGAETLRPYLQNIPISTQITTLTFPLTLVELETLQTNMSQQLADLNFPHSSSINIKENRVEIEITDEAMFNETLANAQIALPKNVELIVIYAPMGSMMEVTAVPNVHMPQLKMPSTAFMEALTSGNLEIVDGCLRIVNGNESQLIIWQTDYFLNDNEGTIEILDRDSNVVAIVGEPIRLGGGETNRPPDELLKEPMPQSCPGPYWFMGEIVVGN